VRALLKWLMPAATGIAGLAAGWYLAGGRGEQPLAVFADRPASIASAPQGLTTDDVRRVVREELARRDGPGESDTAGRPPLTESAPVPSARESAAAAQAQSVLETAISRHAWTEADADAMREVFSGMNADQQGEILRQYAQAVNQGRLVPQTDRVPF
jgi:hypothetical protein